MTESFFCVFSNMVFDIIEFTEMIYRYNEIIKERDLLHRQKQIMYIKKMKKQFPKGNVEEEKLCHMWIEL